VTKKRGINQEKFGARVITSEDSIKKLKEAAAQKKKKKGITTTQTSLLNFVAKK